ncbi:MAG TPA: hypothetical protein VMB66_02595 [Candidatus Acidoferrales bacterium]|nr:hypothetical protein [Candidatus Acidoferrales bacterium]
MYPYKDHEYSCESELNDQLQAVHLELLSAHCATHQLRLHYSSDELARFGRRDVLRKSAQAASELNEFYAAIEKRIPQANTIDEATAPTVEQAEQAVRWVVGYLEQQREKYLPVAEPLSQQHKALLWPYFSPELLEQIRVIDLRGTRVEVPSFYVDVRALGFEPPEITHMDSLTFIDVVVFNQQLSERALFHALVHSVQIRILGLRRYAELWVQSFIRTKAHFTVPLEVHAFSLASKFLRPVERFSVEDHVLRWVTDGRY